LQYLSPDPRAILLPERLPFVKGAFFCTTTTGRFTEARAIDPASFALKSFPLNDCTGPPLVHADESAISIALCRHSVDAYDYPYHNEPIKQLARREETFSSPVHGQPKLHERHYNSSDSVVDGKDEHGEEERCGRGK